MAFFACTCLCGGAESLLRSRVRKYNRQLAMSLPQIPKGREKSLALVSTLPQTQSTSDLAAHIRANSKWAVVICTTPDGDVRWVDLANGKFVKNDVDLELMIKHFGDM